VFLQRVVEESKKDELFMLWFVPLVMVVNGGFPRAI
jgi:hypothetical protein